MIQTSLQNNPGLSPNAAPSSTAASIPSYGKGKHPLIEIVNLSQVTKAAKGTNTILSNINLNIYPGEYIMFFGLSGSGKTSLINTIIGIEKPTSGQILIGGRDITKFSNDDLARWRLASLGIVYEDEDIVESLTVLENVELPATMAGIGEERRKQMAQKLIAMFRIQDIAESMPSSLSSGQKRKVAVARSLINSPIMLVADSITEGLDTKSADDILENIRFVNEQSAMTVLLATNNPDFVYYPHRVVYLTDGKISRIVENRPLRQL